MGGAARRSRHGETAAKDNIGKRNLKLVLDVIGGPLSRQMELMEDRGVSDALENATTAPSLDERDVHFINQLEGRTALLQRYEEFDDLCKNTRSLAAVAGARDESAFAPKEAFAAQNALIAELTAQGFFGPPNLRLAGFRQKSAA